MVAAGPVGERERIAELDVLRGIALFGVLTMNFVGFTGEGVTATGAQLAALPTAAIDEKVYWAVRWLIGDKANTMFATLFGLGFYLQMKRGEGRAGFERRYSRRLFWLLVFGVLNALLLWVWDILNLYAIAGFALLAMRRWRTRSLVVFGLVASLYSEKLQEWWTGALGLTLVPQGLYSEPAVLERQAALLSSDYGRMVTIFAQWTWLEWIAGGLMAAWLVYALGRFALGAAIGRSGILSDIPAHLPLLRRVAAFAIPVGLAAGFAIRLLYTGSWQPLGEGADWLKSLGQALRSPAALVLAAGYSAGIVVALHSRIGGLFALFAPVGRMALTNYLAQGLLYAFVLSGFGLALAGRIGATAVLFSCIAFFAFQVAYSHWWLARFRFGPMEWLWRALTYGDRPAMRHRDVVAAAVA